MHLYTKNEILQKYGTTISEYSIKEQFKLITRSFDESKSYHIFLSHKYSDVPLIYGIIQLLKNDGYEIYIDWEDETLPDRSQVGVETALKIRKKFKACKSLIFIDSPTANESKWIPWEIGCFDGFKNKVAIFPIESNDNKIEYNSREYIGLYPYIIDYNNILYIKDNNSLFKPLKDWITY